MSYLVCEMGVLWLAPFAELVSPLLETFGEVWLVPEVLSHRRIVVSLENGVVRVSVKHSLMVKFLHESVRNFLYHIRSVRAYLLFYNYLNAYFLVIAIRQSSYDDVLFLPKAFQTLYVLFGHFGFGSTL